MGKRLIGSVGLKPGTDTGTDLTGTISEIKVEKGMLIFKKFTYSNAGNYHLIGTVDYNNNIKEAFENHNQETLDIVVS